MNQRRTVGICGQDTNVNSRKLNKKKNVNFILNKEQGAHVGTSKSEVDRNMTYGVSSCIDNKDTHVSKEIESSCGVLMYNGKCEYSGVQVRI